MLFTDGSKVANVTRWDILHIENFTISLHAPTKRERESECECEWEGERETTTTKLWRNNLNDNFIQPETIAASDL